LSEKLRTSIMVRRKKSEVLHELPPKRRVIVELPSDGMEDLLQLGVPLYETYRQRIAELEGILSKVKASEHPGLFSEQVKALQDAVAVAFEEMSEVRYKTALKKVPIVIQRLKESIEDNPEHKIVVFAYHRDVLEQLAAAFPKQSVMIVGGMTEKAKDAAVTSFQLDSSIQFFFGQIEAAGVGLTLTASSHVIMVEDHWVPGMVTQAEDRTHRVGQKNAVFVEHLVVDGSIDVKIVKDLIEKQEVIDRALDVPIPTEESLALPKVTLATNTCHLTDKQIGAVQQGLRALLDKGERAVVGMYRYISQRLVQTQCLSPAQAMLGLRVCSLHRSALPTELADVIFSVPRICPPSLAPVVNFSAPVAPSQPQQNERLLA
jgi:hypothetical protein